MRITHVSDFYLPRLGGIELHVHDLATRQAAAGHDVTILTSSPAGPGPDADTGVHVERVTTGRRRSSALSLAAPPMVARRMRAMPTPDVVHAHAGVWSPSTFAGAWTAQALGVPTVVTYHSLLSWAAPVYRYGDAVVGWSRRRVHWTAVSNVAAAPLQRLLPAGTEVDVLPNAVDLTDWQVRPAPRAADEVLFVAVLRLSPRKRPLRLVHMVRDVARQLPPAVRLRVAIVGEGSERTTLERGIRRCGLGGVVELPGRLSRSEIRRLYERADVFVAPASLESFGIAALEARSAGLPVVAMAGTGIVDFVEDGRTGLIVDDDAGMTAAMARLAVDAPLRRRLAETSRANPPDFGWDQALAASEAAYDRAARIAGRPRHSRELTRVG